MTAPAPPNVDMLAVRDRRTRPPLGLCRGCRRAMYGASGVSHRQQHCAVCRKFRADFPDRPFEESTGLAGVQPQSRTVAGGTDWKTWAACRGADPVLFEVPDVDPPLRARQRRERAAALRATARDYCGGCLVREICAAEADRHQYEGLFGGVLRVLNTVAVGRGRWRHDLVKMDLLARTTAPRVRGGKRSGAEGGAPGTPRDNQVQDRV